MLITFIGVVYIFNFQVKCTDRKAKINTLKLKFSVINLALKMF